MCIRDRASAVVGFMNVFQTDEPAGCYADLDNADVFVTWGANMAEAHPMLYSRLTARKLSGKNVKHYDLGTLRTRTSVSADTVMLFKPNTDLAIANCIANYLVQNKKYDEAFVHDHLQFKQGTENIGNATDDGYDKSDIGQAVDNVEPCLLYTAGQRFGVHAGLGGAAEHDVDGVLGAAAPQLDGCLLYTSRCV